MANNLITAVFSEENPTRSIATPQSWQWDVGQILKIIGLGIPNGTQAHFIINDQSVTQLIGVVDGVGYVHVPDEFFQEPGTSTAYVYISESDTVAETEYTIMFTVRERVQPADYSTPTEAEETLFQEAIDAVRIYAERADDSADDAADSATMAKSWAIGGTGTREGEDADNAKYYATNASASAGAAAVSATDAVASAVSASGSAESAAGAKTAAEAAQATATAKATEAANSAGAAGVSAAAAAASETEARTYAGAASSSASSALGSASAAAGSASAAASSASSAESSATSAAAALEDVTDAKQDALTAISGAQTTAVGAVTAEGTRQVGLVTAEGTTQKNAVQAKGTEVIASIPSDYTALSNSVSELKSDFDALGLSVVDGKICVTWEVA